MSPEKSPVTSPVPSLPDAFDERSPPPSGAPVPLRVPGFGMPVVQDRDTSDFENCFSYAWTSDGITVREQRMMAFVDALSDKPDWTRKVSDDIIVDKWRAEVDVRPVNLDGDVMLSERMFNFCIEELRDKAAIFKETGLIDVFDGDLTIVKSDVAVSEELRKALCEGIKVLEDVPNNAKDWHPRSDGMVLDLVHPSLFPVTYGLTKVMEHEEVPLDGCLAYIGKGTKTDDFERFRLADSGPYEWGSFQWLPTDVELTDSGAKLKGYINNLHPEKHRGLYKILEDILSATVPLWERCLGGFKDRRRIKLRRTGEDDWRYPDKYRIPGRPDGPKAWYDPNTETIDGESYWEDSDEGEFLYEDDYEEWQRENRILKQREPREYKPQAKMTKPVNLRGRYPKGLQVIFKLANIQLTPEKPEYEGGSWHVEGGRNESICASAIYYYDQENIADSHLAFRQALDAQEMGSIPEQGAWQSLEWYLDIEQDGPAVQSLGKVLTREGRLLAFPNCVQHQVQSFALEDKSKPGHRKILAMFLIDPGRRVLSTSNVPPQRKDWWAEELHKAGGLRDMPPEIVDHTIDLVDEFPVSWEKAVEMRETLMDERSHGNTLITEKMMEETFFFCEH